LEKERSAPKEDARGPNNEEKVTPPDSKKGKIHKNRTGKARHVWRL